MNKLIHARIRQATENDFEQILALNQAAVQYVNPLDLGGLRKLARSAAYFRLAETGDQIAGFLIAMDHASAYPSIYFQWFCERYDKFLYIDRVIVAEWARGKRIAWRLFEDVEQCAANLSYPLTSDVYSDPPNEISLRFHQKFGFQLVGTQLIEDGNKKAAKFYKETNAPSTNSRLFPKQPT